MYWKRIDSFQKNSLPQHICFFFFEVPSFLFIIIVNSEVEFDCRFAALGKPIELEKLDVTVTMTSDVDVTPSPSVNVKNDGDKRTSDVRHAQPIVFVHRTPADTGQQDITVNSLEDIVRFAYLLPQPAYHPLNAMVTNKTDILK